VGLPTRILDALRRRRTALGVALVSVVALRAALPFALEWVVQWQGTRQLGRVVEVGDVDLAVLRGGVALEALAVGPLFEGDDPPPLDPEEVHFRSDRIEARWSWLALLRGEIHLEGIEIAAPLFVAVRAADGHLVPVLRPRPAAAPAEPEPEAAGAGWPLRLDGLRLTDLDLLYLDLAIAGLRPLELQMEEFTLDALRLEGGELALGALGLRGPRLRVRRDIDLEPFTGGAAEEVEAEPEVAAGEPPAPPAVRVADVSLERAEFELLLDEREVGAALTLHARNLSAEPGTRFPLDLRLEIEGGSLEIEGEVGAIPTAFDGEIRWSELPLEPLVAAAELPLALSSGASSGALAVDLLLAGTPEQGASRVDVSGRLDVHGLDGAASDGSLAASWSLLEVELAALALRPDGEEGRPIPPAIELAALRLRDPALRVARSPAAPGAAGAEEPEAAAADEPEAAQADAAAPASPAPRVSLALLEVSGGSAEVVDETVTPTYRSQLRELSVRGRDLRWPERDARELKVSARGPEETRFALDASLRGGNGRVKLDLEELGLARFSPYAAETAGYWVEGGRASLRAEVVIEGEAYALDSDLALHKLDVAEVKAGSFEKDFGVPLDLALALLRDPSGKMGIPIAAKLEGGRSRIAVASVVAAALRQALVGALTAPLKGLGLLLGSGEGEDGLRLEPLAAAPGARVPDLAAAAPLAELLAARPGLGLTLRGRFGPEDDRALAERILTEQVVADAELPPVSAGPFQRRRLRGALEDRSRGEARELDADDAAALERWIEAVEVTDESRRALAAERAAALRDALVAEHGIGSERIALGEPLEGAPGVVIGLAPFER
jgi:hypothetical protein